MSMHRVCIPLDLGGAVGGRCGQASSVITCVLNEGEISDWVEHHVAWDNNYGVDVPGVHHPRLVRFLTENKIDLVIADDVCPGVRRTLSVLGIDLREHVTGDPRDALRAELAAV